MCDSQSAPAVAVRFMLDADPDPGLLCRLLIPFARRGLVPDRMWSHRGAEAVHVEVALEAAPSGRRALRGPPAPRGDAPGRVIA